MKYLFVCKSNVGRSQMALAFFDTLAQDGDAISAGTHAKEKEGEGLHEYVIQAMREVGCDVSKRSRKQLTPEMVKEADRIIVMLDDHRDLPDYAPLNKVKFWDIPDAKDTPIEFHRKIRDLIEKKVAELLNTKMNNHYAL